MKKFWELFWCYLFPERVALLVDNANRTERLNAATRALDLLRTELHSLTATAPIGGSDLLLDPNAQRAMALRVLIAQGISDIDELSTERLTARRAGLRRLCFRIGIVLLQPVAPVSTWFFFFGFKKMVEQEPLIRPLGVVLLLVWGGSLFVLRRDFRRIYGVIELSVAAIFANAAVDLMVSEGGIRGALQGAAAIYLTVRAIDNISVGHRAATNTIRQMLGSNDLPGALRVS